MCYKKIENGIRLFLYVQPNASKSEVVGRHGEELKIKLMSPPIDGEANQELIEFLAKLLGIPKKRILLIRGQTNRHKIIDFIDVTEETIIHVLKSRGVILT